MSPFRQSSSSFSTIDEVETRGTANAEYFFLLVMVFFRVRYIYAIILFAFRLRVEKFSDSDTIELRTFCHAYG